MTELTNENSAENLSDNAATERETPTAIFKAVLNHSLGTVTDRYRAMTAWVEHDWKRVAAESARVREKKAATKKPCAEADLEAA